MVGRRVDAVLAAVVCLVLGSHVAFGCGDKFIFTSSNSSMERADAAAVPAKVLIYRDAETDPTSVMYDPGLGQALSQAGHTPSTVDGAEGLAGLAAQVDIVLVEYRSAREVRDRLQASSGMAVVVPVLDRAARKQLSAAKREFGVVINVPASVNTLLRAIDRAVSR